MAEYDFDPYLRQLIAQYEMLGLVWLGKLPEPTSGETQCSLPHAKAAIDTVEMLAAKTRGNLTSAEDQEMRRVLTLLRLNFVEEVNREQSGAGKGEQEAPPVTEPAAGQEAEQAGESVAEPAAGQEAEQSGADPEAEGSEAGGANSEPSDGARTKSGSNGAQKG
ncbi:MAG: DUF1844 domain-containing protein [Candidatus Eisenbacteria sp.]|nr:DUF1844 domain-containing protein [Candidatus Eisenbacteria bacterium]